MTTCASPNPPLCQQGTDAGGTTAIFYMGPVNINRRLFMIPSTITSANQAAHQAIAAVNNQAVWLNYRLINIQARPIDISNVNASDEPTYYLSNEVVETNPSLQHFSGGLNVGNGRIFDYSCFSAPQARRKRLQYLCRRRSNQTRYQQISDGWMHGLPWISRSKDGR